MGEQVLVVGDALVEVGDLVDELLAREAGEAAQAHLENRLGLHVVEAERVEHALLGLGVVARGANDVDDLVDVVDGDEQALEDVHAGTGLIEVELGAAGHDVDLVVDVVVQHLAQRKRLGHAVDQRDVNRAERGLELRLLVQVVENDLGHGTLLEVDDDAHALLEVGLVAHVGDALDLLLVDRLGDLLLEQALVDLIGDLGHDEARTAALDLLHVHLGAHGDRAAARLVGFADALGAHDDAARGEVGAREHGHKVVDRRIGVVDHHAHGVGDLAEVMRRDVGGHADGDARAAVDQQVGEARGKHRRLGERLVVVGLEIDRLLVEIGQQLHGRAREAALGVTHGRGAVAVDVAEVAVAVDEREAHGPILRHADHRVVDGGIAVRVVLAHDFADRPRGLLVRAVGRDARLGHGVEDAAVHRLEAVAHVGQCAGHDDRHRVLEEGGLHLLPHVDGLQRSAMDVGEREARAGLVGQRAREVLACERGARLLVLLIGLVGVVVLIVLVVVVVSGVVEDIVEVGTLLGLELVVFAIVCHCWAFLVSASSVARQMSRKRTSLECVWMNSLRFSTWLPMRSATARSAA